MLSVARSFSFMLVALLFPVAATAQPWPHGSPHDFDFEFGAWTAHVERLVHDAHGRSAWASYDGSSVVRPIWHGNGNIGELDVAGPAGRIVGVTIRLFDPQTRQWGISWANARDAQIGTPMTGGFANGPGLFYDREKQDGKTVMYRFVFAPVSRIAFRLVQSYSNDDGRTWIANWKARFARVR